MDVLRGFDNTTYYKRMYIQVQTNITNMTTLNTACFDNILYQNYVD
jgi:hypothetical protein